MGTPAECIHHGSRDLLEQRRQYPREHSIRYLESHLESHLAASRRRRIERPMAVEMGEGSVDQLDFDSFRIHHPVTGREGLPERSARNFQACRHYRRGARMHRRGTAPGKKPRVALDIRDEAEHVRRRERNVGGTGNSGHPSMYASHRARTGIACGGRVGRLQRLLRLLNLRSPLPRTSRVGNGGRRGSGPGRPQPQFRRMVRPHEAPPSE